MPLQQMLYREAYRMLGDAFEAEDAVQNLYVRLWEQKERIDHLFSSKEYCLKALKNICIDRWRKIKARDEEVELQKEMKYPKEAQDKGIQGRVIVQFVVNKDGSICDEHVVRSVDPQLDAEALRVVRSMPNWTPGKQRGQAVRVRFTLPVTFRLAN